MPADTNSLRASVYDVFLELGALDANNSRAAAWFFGDPTISLSDLLHDSPAQLPREAVRFLPPDSPPSPSESEVRPTSRSSFALKFSPRRMRARSKTKSTVSSRNTTNNDGYETDEGYASASPTGTPNGSPRGRSRLPFSLRSSTKSGKPLPAVPPLPPIKETQKEKPTGTVSRRARSLFRKRAKSPEPAPQVEPEAEPRKSAADSLMQWQSVANITPRKFNPSAENGEPVVSPFAPPAPSSFRLLVAPAEDQDSSPPRQERLSFALPLSVFRSLTLNKRRTARPASPAPSSPSRAKARPQSLDLAPTARLASSLPASPFILVTEDDPAPVPLPGTPFVFVTPIQNPTPLHSATMRRFSDVTSMTAPLGLGVYPLSISRTIRRSMAFDTLDVPSSPPARLRPSSSYSSFQDALQQAASAASPYEMYDEPVSRIRRGVEAPFPAHPILRQPLSMATKESRLATIQRYREFSEQLVEVMPYKRGSDEA
ncbi:hypothetical protein HMN09_01420800 [Mycena chlorophos]|uniref:Uncharacterized protein n=1 Tax=Mycena chlorophos TaxID=658473 RepID=A0A8H6RXN0_MYCCL|nr:hypothetical protein HMN09_01420800 [Mycena chlorophos]